MRKMRNIVFLVLLVKNVTMIFSYPLTDWKWVNRPRFDRLKHGDKGRHIAGVKQVQKWKNGSFKV